MGEGSEVGKVFALCSAAEIDNNERGLVWLQC